MAHSGGGAGMTVLLRAAWIPTKWCASIHCTAAKSPWRAGPRDGSRRAPAMQSGLRAFYTPCGAGVVELLGGRWEVAPHLHRGCSPPASARDRACPRLRGQRSTGESVPRRTNRSRPQCHSRTLFATAARRPRGGRSHRHDGAGSHLAAVLCGERRLADTTAQTARWRRSTGAQTMNQEPNPRRGERLVKRTTHE